MREREDIEARIEKIQQKGLIEVITSKLLLEVLLDIRDLLNDRNAVSTVSKEPRTV